MVQKNFQRVAEVLDEAVQNCHIPGAVIAITTSDETIYKGAFGYSHETKRIQMREDTIFDLASLTKVTATLPAIIQLQEKGLLDIDDSVSLYLPQLEKNHYEVTIKHLLTHTSGFRPEIKFYRLNANKDEVIDLISNLEDRKPVETEVIYSDLNFILLGKIVEQIVQMPLDVYTATSFYEPLEMNDTYFNPPESEKNRIAATEFMESIQDFQWGKVHDENTFHFGGVSGHAGLFSTAEDLTRYARMLLNGGDYGKGNLLTTTSIELTIKSFTKGLNLNRGLGWQLYDPSSFSGQFLQDGFGHTGFTGTSIWISPKLDVAIIFLTNRVHFGRSTNIHRLRKIIHNLVAITMDGATRR